MFLCVVYELRIDYPHKDEAEEGENKRLYACDSPELY
jgi:hypothetical protein